MAVGKDEEVPLLDGLCDVVLYFLWAKGLPLGRYKYTAMVKQGDR